MMFEVSLSFMAWMIVLFIQVIVHLRVVYLRKVRNEDDDVDVLEADSPDHTWYETESTTTKMGGNSSTSSSTNVALRQVNKRGGGGGLINRKYMSSHYRSCSDNPALDDASMNFHDEFDDVDEEYDEEPPNLEQRLSQTGCEMMRSCESLESFVHEQIPILSQ